MADRNLVVSANWTLVAAGTDNWTVTTDSGAAAGYTYYVSASTTNNQWMNITGSAGADTIIYSATGTGVTSTLSGGAGADIIMGGAGNDLIIGGTGNDAMIGGAGSDTFLFRQGDGADTITGANTYGSTGDVLRFADSNFSGMAFSVNGGDYQITYGNSTANAVLVTSTTTISAGTTAMQIQTVDKTFGLVIGTAAGTLTGTTAVEYIMDTANAGSILNGAGGADTLVGGTGADTLVYNSATALMNGGAGLDTLTATAQSSAVYIGTFETKYVSLETVIGSEYNDLLIGSAGSETLVGGSGNDNLWGYTGADVMAGGLGNDTYWFGTGDGHDTASAGATIDQDVYNFYGATASQLSFAQSGNDMLISLNANDDLLLTGANNFSYTSGIQHMAFIQTTDNTFHLLTDNAATSNLVGTAVNDYVVALAGTATTLDGGSAGADTLKGGAGNDTLVFRGAAYTAANQGTDLAVVNGGAGTDTLTAAGASSAVFIGTYQSKFSSIEVVTGSAYDDLLIGSAGAETLNGGNGNDNLWGYTGNDVMAGGNGLDTYWFGTGDGADTIASDTASNHNDTVQFYAYTSTSAVTTAISGNNLVITAGSDTLTLANWNVDGDGARVNRFTFGTGASAVTYSLNNTATSWTRIS